MKTIKTTADLSQGAACVGAHADTVRLVVRDSNGHGTGLFLPEEARALASALLRAADDAEGIDDPEVLNNLHANVAAYNDATYAEDACVAVSDVMATLERWFPMGEGK